MSNQQQSVELRGPSVVAPAAQPPAAAVTSPSLSLPAYLARSRTMPLMIAGAIFAIFLPAVIVPYAFSDDYPILWMAVSGDANPFFGKNIFDTTASGGRPLMGLLLQFLYSAAGTIDNLRFVRLVGIAGIVALALLLHWALVRSRIKPAPAALITLVVCSMPAFQVAASWAVLVGAPYAALLGGGASVLAVTAIDTPDLTKDLLVVATLMLVVALLIYQPAAMFFWVFLAVALVGAARESARPVRVLRTQAGVGAAALAIAFVLGKLAAHTVHYTTPNTAHSALTHDVAGKVRWFIEHPLYRSASLFELTPSPWLAAIVAGVAAGGIGLWLLHRGARPLLYLLSASVLIPLSFLPNLVVNENNSFVFRTGIALTSLIALYACLGLLGLSLLIRDWLQPRIGVRAFTLAGQLAFGISIASVAAIAFVASRNVTTLVVDPQSTELRVIRSHVAALPTSLPRVGFVGLAWDQGMTRWYSDEIGVPSSARPWTPEPAVFLLLREKGRLDPAGPRPIVDWLPWDTTTLPQDEPVIDLRGELQRLGR